MRHCKGCDEVLQTDANVRMGACSNRCRARIRRHPELSLKYPEETVTRVCPVCDSEFEPRRRDAIYCSRACVDKRQRPVVEQARRRVRKNAAARTPEGRRKDAERKHRRRARKAFAVPQRWVVSEHDADRCYWGGCELTDENRVVDHVMPIALGGPHDPTNTVPSCWDCNHEKRHKHPLVWLALQF